MKKLIFVFLLGFFASAMLFCVTPIRAAIDEYICYKADYNLEIGGMNYSDPDIPILNYKGYTVVSVRKLLEFIGYTVTYDAKTKTATAVYNGSGSTTDSKTSGGGTVSQSTKAIYTPDGIKAITIDGKVYIETSWVNQKYKDKFEFKAILSQNIYRISRGETIIIDIPLDNIKHMQGPTSNFWEYEFYVNTIMPLLKE